MFQKKKENGKGNTSITTADSCCVVRTSALDWISNNNQPKMDTSHDSFFLKPGQVI